MDADRGTSAPPEVDDDALKDVDAEFEVQDDSREAVLTSWLHQDEKDPDVVDADKRMAALFARAAKSDAPPRATSDEGGAEEPTIRRSRAKRTVLVLGAVVVLIAAAVIVGVQATHNTSPQAALSDALDASAAGKTADVVMTLHLRAGDASSETGRGQVSLVTDSSNLAVMYRLPGQALAGRTIVDGPMGYYDIGPWLATVIPGKSWISLDERTITSGISGVGFGGIFANPGSLLAVLRTPSAVVRAVGPAKVDGTSVTGYAVHLPDGTRGLVSGQVPAFVRSEARQIRYSHLDYVVYVDGAHHVRQVRATGAYRVNGRPVTVSTTLDLSHYGAPLRVVVPARVRVVTSAELDRTLSQQQSG